MFAKVKPNSQIIGQKIFYLKNINSTNSLLSELYKNNILENGTVAIAENQTDGRGQQGRTWMSEPFENLTFSFYWQSKNTESNLPILLNKCITLAILNFLSEKLPETTIKIKWPNDIYVNNRKICGVLIENILGKTNNSIIGIGLNVNQRMEHLTQIQATSMCEQSGYIFDREEIFTQLLEDLDEALHNMHKTKQIETDYNTNLLGYKSVFEFNLNNEIVNATIEGCNEYGQLVLRKQNEIICLSHGTVKQVILQ